jgi:hypothetical protein
MKAGHDCFLDSLEPYDGSQQWSVGLYSKLPPFVSGSSAVMSASAHGCRRDLVPPRVELYV